MRITLTHIQQQRLLMNNFSKIGFILAALGSSIGLGHIWRFPYVAGTTGGGALVPLYLVLSLPQGKPRLSAAMLTATRGGALMLSKAMKILM